MLVFYIPLSLLLWCLFCGTCKIITFSHVSRETCIIAFLFFLIFLKDFIYLFHRQRSQVGREAGRERGRSRLPAEQRARCGTRSQDPEIMTWAEGRGLTHWATQAPRRQVFLRASRGSSSECAGHTQWRQSGCHPLTKALHLVNSGAGCRQPP